MRICLTLSFAAMFNLSVIGQSHYTSKQGKPLELLKTVDLRTVEHGSAFIEFLEAPYPGGERYKEFLNTQKEQASRMFPKNSVSTSSVRSFVEPPELINSFSGNSYTAGIPLDNHLAANRKAQIVSVVNTHMVVIGPTGVWQESYSLDDFWTVLGETNFYFDPRVIYDPIEDRFILVMMQDSDCSGSNIVFAFSETEDPTGVWHLYRFEGCPNLDATFADYPMISLTNGELFFTYNAVYQDSTWQTGFNQTLIYQINKFDGYAGEQLRWKSWSDIAMDGRNIRYMCPVKTALSDLSDECWFVSDRSFDIQNDTFFLVHISGNMDDPKTELSVQYMVSEQPYGVPPNAQQPKDFLQTNDARVLDAFYTNDQIQFVTTTMDFETGRSAVYHGTITDISFDPKVSGRILRNDSDYFAYPGIAYMGDIPGDNTAIIIALHASSTRYPGYSALYYDGAEYSEWIPVKEGLRNIDMIKENNPYGLDPTIERWGDYCGIQLQYEDPGAIWTASVYGKPGNLNDTWIGHLRKPGEASAVNDVESTGDVVIAYPNPATSHITIEAEIDGKGKRVSAVVYDIQGNALETVFNKTSNEDGPIRLHYLTSRLSPGSYVIRLLLDEREWASKVFVVE